MIYNNGFKTDSNLRFVNCPKCGNEEYSEKAMYCRNCGFSAHNECEGYCNQKMGEPMSHRNVGNARYCEFCGQLTMLFKERLLKPYKEVQATQNEQDDEELPFSTDEDYPF